jgi:hypothetical protein
MLRVTSHFDRNYARRGKWGNEMKLDAEQHCFGLESLQDSDALGRVSSDLESYSGWATLWKKQASIDERASLHSDGDFPATSLNPLHKVY